MPERATVLLLPGLYNSGPAHWQSHWERELPGCVRVAQADWETPRCEDWVARLEAAAEATPGPLLLAAHSLACTLVAHWAGRTRNAVRVRGALLVAPSDLEAPSYPPGTHGFGPMPLRSLPFPALVVASTDDPYVSLARAQHFARAWGARCVDVGAQGHLGSAANLGAWPQGQALLAALLAGDP